MARVALLILFGVVIAILPSSESMNVDGGRQARSGAGQNSWFTRPSGNLLRSKPIDPSQGRGRQSGGRRRTLSSRRRAEEQISEERINEMTRIFKANVRRLWTSQQLDLVFVIDESNSVGLQNFLDEIKFVARFVSGIEVDMNHTRVAVVTYADNVTLWVNQVSSGEVHAHKCSLLGQDLPSIQYFGGGTYTKGALAKAETIFENARPNSKKVVFLITDGYSNGGDPRPLASALKRQLVEVFTLGIKDGDKVELSEIASVPKSQHRLILNSFKEFDMVARRALHSDAESGRFIIEDSSHCDKHCTDADCCDASADCRCGTTTGQYECVCKPGHYGPGLKQIGCRSCPEGTYKDEALPGDETSCIPCPDSRMTSPMASTSIHQCTCPEGFKTEEQKCKPVMCNEIILPMNGNFLACDGVYLSTCTIACDKGYDLQGTAILMCGKDETWITLDGSEKQEVFCQVRYCDPLEPPDHGMKNCSKSDSSYSTECDIACEEGYRLHGSPTRMCEADRHWTGAEAECREITCPSLPRPSHAVLSGDCNNEAERSVYGDQCSFSCPLQGFELMVAPTVTCSDSGQWQPSIPEESLRICNDTSPPQITCPPDMTIPTGNRKPFADVTWSPPIPTDNSKSVTLTPEWSFPVALGIGEHSITYTATDDSGLRTQCQFTITVEDDEPPMIERCRGPQPFVIERGDTEAENVTWIEPTFSDNSGSLTTSGNGTFGTYPIGVTVIEYVAQDASGNTRACTIDIIVQDNACKPRLEKPRNGHIDCQLISDFTECEFVCNSDWFGFAMIEFGQPIFICRGNKDEWSPKASIPYDCSKQKYSSEVLKDFTATYDMATLSSCNNTEFIEAVQQAFIDIFSVEIPKLCEGKVDGHLRCTLKDVTVKCIGVIEHHEDYDNPYGSYGYYGYNTIDEEDQGRRKRSLNYYLAKRQRRKHSQKRIRRDADESEPTPTYSEGDGYGDAYGDYPSNPADYNPGVGEVVQDDIPEDILRDSNEPADPDVNVDIDGIGEIPDSVVEGISNIIPDVIPPDLLGQTSEKEGTREKLEVTLTIRGEVTLDGISVQGDRKHHSRMVEFIRNLDLSTAFAERGILNQIPSSVIKATNTDHLTYSEDTYGHSKDELICPVGTVLKDKAFCGEIFNKFG